MEELLDFIITFSLDVYCDLATELIPDKLTPKRKKLLKIVGGITSILISLFIIVGAVLLYNKISIGFVFLITGIALAVLHIILIIIMNLYC